MFTIYVPFRVKYLFYTALLMLCQVSAVAQQLRMNSEYVNRVSFLDNTPYLYGKASYGYVVGDDGYHLKDGAFTASCTLDEKYSYYSITARLSLNANFKRGLLNGALKSNCNVSRKNRNSTETYVASITGKFTKGVPDGAFTVRCSARKTALNANFKKGVLVGAYSCSVYHGYSDIKYSGSFTQNGKFTGKWNFNGLTATFQNGVRINISSKEKSTRPALVELSKKYAAGTMSRSDLEKKLVFVKVDSVPLIDYARTAILRYSGVDFDRLGGYDFNHSGYVKYEYLTEVIALTDKGAAELSSQVCERLASGWEYGGRIYSEPSSNDKYGCIKYDSRYGAYYITMNIYDQKNYIDAGCVNQRFENVTEKVYILPKHMSEIEKTADVILCNNAMSIKDFIQVVLPGSEKVMNYLSGGSASNTSLEELESFRDRYNALKNNFSYYPSSDNHMAYSYPKDGFDFYCLDKNSVDNFDIDGKIEEFKFETAVPLIRAVKMIYPECADALAYFDKSSNRTSSLSIFDMEKALEKYNSVKASIKPYPSGEKPVLYHYNRDEDIYISINSVNAIDMDKRLEEFKLETAVSMTDMMRAVRPEYANALDYVEGCNYDEGSLTLRDLEGAKREFDNLRSRIAPYPSKAKYELYHYSEGYRKFYVRKNQIDDPGFDEMIEKFRLDNAIMFKDFIVEYRFANADAIAFLNGSKVNKLKDAVKGLKRALKDFKKGCVLHPESGDVQVYLYEMNGVRVYVNKVSVDSFENYIEAAKQQRQKEKKAEYEENMEQYWGY